MTVQPKAAMLLAAGLGTRMRPLTEHTAKPLLPLAGRTLIDHALDRLAAASVGQVVVNAHWHADLVGRRLSERRAGGEPPVTILRHETALLDTGGAVHAALQDGLLGTNPIFVVNGDSFWLDGPVQALGRLAGIFDPARHDAVILVHRTFQVTADVGTGDFFLDPWGVPRRPRELEIVPYVYAGVQIVSPALFAGHDPGTYSMNRVWDRAIEAGRIEAVVHDGLWFHLSTPSDLEEAETSLRERVVGETR
jgi:MurNAc alpha-1-phosphate uridylyltransferase